MAASLPVATPMGPQVFISFRGEEMRGNFVSFLRHDLRVANINVFMDEDLMLGTDLDDLFVRIEESEIALVIFSREYASSYWCLDELAKIKECKDQNRLRVIPIFYRLEPSTVNELRGEFGDNFRDLERRHRSEPERTRKWKEALESIPLTTGMPLSQQSDKTDRKFINSMVVKIQRVLAYMAISAATQTVREANREGSSVVPPMVPPMVHARQPKAQVLNHHEGSMVPSMIPARQLRITHSEDPKKWAWNTIYEAPDYAALEISKMLRIHWLKIVGTFETGHLTPGTMYEAVFVVKLEDDACGWEQPVTLKLKVENHDGSDNRVDRTSNLKDYIGHDWVDILAGVFLAPPRNEPAKITFTMYQYETNDRKKGLVVKGVAIRPTN